MIYKNRIQNQYPVDNDYDDEKDKNYYNDIIIMIIIMTTIMMMMITDRDTMPSEMLF